MHIKKLYVGICLFITLLCWVLYRHYTEKYITIGFLGDIMIGRLVDGVLEQKGPTYIWTDVRQQLGAYDYVIANLETALTTSTTMVQKVFNYKSAPRHVEALIKGHISLVNLANNHTRDFSDEGLLETISVLDNARIAHVGAGKNAQEAQQPVIFEKYGIRIGIVGFTDNEPSWAAGAQRPGVNYITVGDIEKVKHDINMLIKNVDIIIATIHWGPNMRSRPTEEFRHFAHAMIDAGVTIIHGHSAHIVQGIERYKNGLIMYDTGDFIDDYAVDPVLRNDLSCIFQVTLSKKGVQKVTPYPVKIDNMQVTFATGEDYELMLNRVHALSAELGTVI